MWQPVNTKKGEWIETRIGRFIQVDAYRFNKTMLDKCDNKVKKAFPFKEVSFRIKTPKQSMWLNTGQIEYLFKAIKDLEKTIGKRLTEREQINLAIRQIKRGV